MRSIGRKKSEEFINDNEHRIRKLNLNIHKRLNKLRNNVDGNERDFLNTIIEYAHDNNINFFNVKPEEIANAIGYKKDNIGNEIEKVFKYNERRRDLLPEYFHAIGIKTCVYCNSNLALSYKTRDGKLIARLEADHYYPKSKYPYLAVSLYNLYPVCGYCNKNKGNTQIKFDLYSENNDNNLIRYKLNDLQLVNHLLNNNEDISFEIIGNELFIEKFDLVNLYNTQTDILEDLINKSMIYTASYKKMLKDDFNINEENINNFVLGNYSNPKDIHKRPMTKFMQDIGKELGII